MTKWEVTWRTVGLCLIVIVVWEFRCWLKRRKIEGAEALELFMVRSRQCSNDDLERLKLELIEFGDTHFLSNVQIAKQTAIIYFISGRQKQIAHDQLASIRTQIQSRGAPPHFGETHRGEAGPHGSNEGPGHLAA